MVASTKSKVTTDHEEIRRWAAVRSGTPAAIVRPENGDEEASPICIDFFENSGEGSRKKISWDDWFKRFDAAGLALLYQEHTASGQRSKFHKVVSRETVDEVEAAVGGKGRSASRRSRRDREAGAIAAPRGGRVGKKSALAAEMEEPAKKPESKQEVVRSTRAR
jgi:hypothetical protein